MKAKRVEFRLEHVLFLWKRFRYISESEIDGYFDISNINLNGCCVEIRSGDSLIAVGISVFNTLTFAAVEEEYRNDNIQIKLINERISFMKEKGFNEVYMSVRCKNIPSWKNALNCGFKIVSQSRYSDDDEGFVLRKSINQ